MLIFLGLFLPALNAQAQTALPYTQGFEGTHGWTLSNGTAVNQWVVGTAVANGGSQSLYISNDNGVTNNYTNTSTSVVHAYKDFALTPTAQEISLEFDWRALAESCCDYLRVWLVPTSFTPTVGSQIGGATDRIDLFGNLNMDASFKREQLIQDVSAYAALGSFRLVFEWRNDGSVGTMPGGAIDNVSINQVTCYQPIGVSIVKASQTSVDVTVTPNPANSVGVSYEYEVRTSGAQGSGTTGFVTSGSSTTANFTVAGLQSGTIYTIYIRTVCGPTDKSIYSSYQFIHDPTPIPYTQDFEGATHDWELSNGTQTNQWVVGSATSNGGTKGMYISDDNGTSNDYNTSSSSVVHAYKDFAIPANISEITLGFDWRALAESCCDYIRVWLVPSSFIPIAGTQITAASDRIDLFGNLNMDATFKREQLIQDITNFTGSFRIIFEWRNDGSVGTMPGGAIDNIEITPITCSRPIDVQISDVTKDAATVTVTPNPKSATNVTYAYEVRESGNPGSGTTGLATAGTSSTSIFTVNGLQPLIKYKIYVKTICSSTDNSIWTDGTSFNTMCDYPELITAPSVTVCGEQEVDLTAIYDAGTVLWYDKEIGGNLVHTGANFTTPLLTVDTSYWVTAENSSIEAKANIGEGTSTGTTSGTFLFHSWGGYKHQYIFTVAELKAAGLTAGDIKGLEFEIVSQGTANRNDFSISLGTTTQNNATTTHIDNSLLTEVYSNTSETFAVGIHTFTFTTPYFWDGISNLVVQTNWSNQNGGGNSGSIMYHTTSSPMTTETHGDNQSAASFLTTNTGSVNGSGNTGTSNDRPNTVFVTSCNSGRTEVKVTVEPKPAFELSTDMVTSCAGGNSEVVTITTNLGGYDTFVWTPSTGVSGDEVNGWTFNTTQEQEYVLSASQSNGICEHLKTVRVFASEIPQADATLASSYDLCKNEVAELKVLEAIPADATIGMPTTTTSATSEMSAYVYSEVYSKQQYIYSAAELIAQGVTVAGYIDELSFETINSGASLTSTEYTVKMMLTPNTTFGTTNFETGNFVTVFSRTNHPHTFQGLQTMTLDSPFYWDGQSNILIEITQEGGATTGTNNAQTYYNTVAGNNVGIYTTSETDPDPLTGTVTNDRLNVKFGLTQAKVTWSPATNLYLDAATTVQYISGTDAATVYVISSGTMNQIYNATITAPTGCEAAIPVTINVTDVATPVVQNQTFCQTTPVSNIVVTGGTGSTTYNFYDSATATTPVTTVSKTGTYYVEAVQGDCKSTRVAFAVTITTLTMPNAQSTQYSCSSGTVADLVATGTSGAQINWYDSATSTTPLSLTTPLVNNTTYYASQTLGNCESGRIAVLVSVGQGPASLTPQTISVCGALNYGNANLNQIAGSELVWYPSSTSQTPIPNTSSVVTGTYYVSQKINGCESQRAQIIVTAQGSVPAPTATIQNICGSGTVAQLTAQILPNATAEWYSNATSTTPLALTTPLTSGTYYLSQRVSNCISVKVPVAVRITSTSAPAVTPIVLCDGAKVGDIDLPMPSGVSYSWYLNSTSTTALPVTDILKSGYYFVTRVENGCESARTQVQITINSRPNSPTGASPQIFTNYAEISNLVMNEPNVVWYATYEDAMNGNNPLQQNMPMINGSTYYAVVIGTNGCPSLPTPVEVEIVLGVNDFDLSKLNYYPNPTSDLLTINYSETITKVEVFDLNGRLVMTRDFESETVRLDFGTLSSGTYMLNVKTKDSSQFIKIVRK
ncbi:T9SS type A sorting domain-containing protein [Flavobacterium dauae]|uniref:Ig-like domain-containing protein n=1 Tax=Flavobacterium dauae TaxID=1563479 RepID=UPI00272E45B7|nr:T9SS type A sorting domain-containing protein [Flavobacterium dauae]WLD24102.1 T9SS type A sorting domain-containing protein [Flavobacterium dauae]